MRYRRIRKWGNSWVIILTSSDAKDFQIYDSEIDIESSLLRFQKERKRKVINIPEKKLEGVL